MSEYNLVDGNFDTVRHFDRNEVLPVKTPGSSIKINVPSSTIKIIIVVLGWYFASSLSNNTNKQILNLMPEPMFLTLIQLAFITIFSYLYLLYKKEFKLLPLQQLVVLMFPLGLLNFFNHFITYTSLKDVPLSFMHTIKATSPIFTVILSYFILGDHTSIRVMVTLIPVIIGVTICTFTETHISTNWVCISYILPPHPPIDDEDDGV
jgi:drug/metabolite transporter (DMT)-like permease